MPIALYRVDERLIHGQVTVGWGMRLRPTRYVVVDDALAGAEWEQDLYHLGAPPGVELTFLGTHDALDALAGWQGSPDVTILLTRDLEHMLQLSRGGALDGAEVNLGGLHHTPGRRSVLPYLFLSDSDFARIRELIQAGAEVTAQDLPGSPRTPASRILEG